MGGFGLRSTSTSSGLHEEMPQLGMQSHAVEEEEEAKRRRGIRDAAERTDSTLRLSLPLCCPPRDLPLLLPVPVFGDDPPGRLRRDGRPVTTGALRHGRLAKTHFQRRGPSTSCTAGQSAAPPRRPSGPGLQLGESPRILLRSLPALLLPLYARFMQRGVQV